MSFIVLLNFAWRPMENATTHRTPTPLYQFQFPSPFPSPLHTLSCSSACLARITLSRLSFAAATLDSHFSVATRLVHLPHLSRFLSPFLSLCLSNCQRSSLRTSWHWELFLCGFQILLQFVNSLLACFLSAFLRLYLAVLCLISER